MTTRSLPRDILHIISSFWPWAVVAYIRATKEIWAWFRDDPAVWKSLLWRVAYSGPLYDKFKESMRVLLDRCPSLQTIVPRPTAVYTHYPSTFFTISADGTRCAHGHARDIVIVDVKTNAILRHVCRGISDLVRDVCFTPNGGLLCIDVNSRLFECTTQENILIAHGVDDVCYDGDVLMIQSTDGSVGTLAKRDLFPAPVMCSRHMRSANGTFVLAWSTTVMYKMAGERKEITVDSRVYDVSLEAKGRLLCVAMLNRLVCIDLHIGVEQWFARDNAQSHDLVACTPTGCIHGVDNYLIRSSRIPDSPLMVAEVLYSVRIYAGIRVVNGFIYYFTGGRLHSLKC